MHNIGGNFDYKIYKISVYGDHNHRATCASHIPHELNKKEIIALARILHISILNGSMVWTSASGLIIDQSRTVLIGKVLTEMF